MDEQLENKPRIVMLGQTPPPYHGQAVATAVLFGHQWNKVDVAPLRMAYSEESEEVGRFRVAKILHLFRLAFQTIRLLRARKGSLLYYPPASPAVVPIIRDVIFLSLVRMWARGSIFHFHAGGLAAYLKSRPILGFFALLAYRKPSLCIEISSLDHPKIGDFFQAAKQTVVPNGLDVPDSVRSSVPKREAKRVLYVGSLSEGKGIFDLLETARLLADRGVDLLIDVAGEWMDEGEKGKAEQLAEQYGLAGRVKFLGLVVGDEKWAVYRQADVFFFPSHYESENFPLVLIEAMACGLPIVSTRWRGIPEMVEEGVTGRVLPINAPAQYADALMEFSGRSTEEFSEMSLQSRRRYEENYTQEVFCARMEEAFTQAAQVANSLPSGQE